MRLGIAGRLGLLLAAVSVLSSGLAGYQVYREGRDRLVAGAHQDQLALTRLLAQRLAASIDATRRDLALLAGGSELAMVLRGDPERAAERAHLEDLAEACERLLRLNPHYLEVALVDRREHGLERLRLERDGDQVRRVAALDLQEKSHLLFVQRGLQQGRGVAFGMPMSTRQGDGAQHGAKDPSLILAMPVHGEGETALGVIAIRIGVVPLIEAMRTDLPPRYQLFVTNREGDYLVHPDPRQAFAFERGRRARAQEEFPATAPLFAEQVVGTPQVAIEDAAGDRIATFLRRELAGGGGERFVLGIAQPLREAMIEPQELAAIGLRMLPVYAMVAVFLAFVGARAATRSLRALAEAAGRLGGDGAEPGASVILRRADEIGDLARSLNDAHRRVTETLAQLEASRNEMMHLARHDPLTGLPNRLLFHERLMQAIARAQRNASGLALLLVDLDGFKPVNDNCGHAAGDHVLRVMAGRMRESVRGMDTVARFGGDEFVVLLEGAADRQGAAEVARKLVELLAQPVDHEGRTLFVGASIGIGFLPPASDSDSLIGAADAAMYRAKAAGGGIYRLAGDEA